MIVIDIFSAAQFTFHTLIFNLVKLFGLSSDTEIISVVTALNPDNCILTIRLNPDRQNKELQFRLSDPDKKQENG